MIFALLEEINYEYMLYSVAQHYIDLISNYQH